MWFRATDRSQRRITTIRPASSVPAGEAAGVSNVCSAVPLQTPQPRLAAVLTPGSSRREHRPPLASVVSRSLQSSVSNYSSTTITANNTFTGSPVAVQPDLFRRQPSHPQAVQPLPPPSHMDTFPPPVRWDPPTQLRWLAGTPWRRSTAADRLVCRQRITSTIRQVTTGTDAFIYTPSSQTYQQVGLTTSSWNSSAATPGVDSFVNPTGQRSSTIKFHQHVRSERWYIRRLPPRLHLFGVRALPPGTPARAASRRRSGCTTPQMDITYNTFSGSAALSIHNTLVFSESIYGNMNDNLEWSPGMPTRYNSTTGNYQRAGCLGVRS